MKRTIFAALILLGGCTMNVQKEGKTVDVSPEGVNIRVSTTPPAPDPSSSPVAPATRSSATELEALEQELDGLDDTGFDDKELR